MGPVRDGERARARARCNPPLRHASVRNARVRRARADTGAAAAAALIPYKSSLPPPTADQPATSADGRAVNYTRDGGVAWRASRAPPHDDRPPVLALPLPHTHTRTRTLRAYLLTVCRCEICIVRRDGRLRRWSSACTSRHAWSERVSGACTFSVVCTGGGKTGRCRWGEHLARIGRRPRAIYRDDHRCTAAGVRVISIAA